MRSSKVPTGRAAIFHLNKSAQRDRRNLLVPLLLLLGRGLPLELDHSLGGREEWREGEGVEGGRSGGRGKEWREEGVEGGGRSGGREEWSGGR